MSKKDKLVRRLLELSKDFTYEELVSLLHFFEFEVENKGKTSGSAVKFKNARTGMRIYLHKPHPGNIVKKYILHDVIEVLKRGGFLDEE